MPKVYSDCPELRDTAERLKEMYYLYIGHIDIASIQFAEIEGKKPKTASPVELSGMSAEWLKQMHLSQKDGKMYCVAAWTEEYEALSPSMREWTLFEALLYIHPENNGKKRKADVVGFGPMIQYLGVYWKDRTDMPSMLADGPVPMIPPPLDQDDGQSINV